MSQERKLYFAMINLFVAFGFWVATGRFVTGLASAIVGVGYLVSHELSFFRKPR